MSYPQHGHNPRTAATRRARMAALPDPAAGEAAPPVAVGAPRRAIGMLVMLVLIGIGNGPTPAASGPVASGSASNPATTADTSADTSGEAVSTPSGPFTTFGPGTWEVGVDITPGKYKTTGPDGSNCYYARLKTGDGPLATSSTTTTRRDPSPSPSKNLTAISRPRAAQTR